MSEFTAASSARMREQGLAEENGPLVPALSAPGVSPSSILLTRSAAEDWEFLASARILGAPMQCSAILAEGVAILYSGRIPKRELVLIDGDGWVWQQRGLRWVIRSNDGWKTIIVHGIAQAGVNPFRKIWRYFDQNKAINLLETSELYLCRVDRLDDTHEARPTRPMEQAYMSHVREVFGAESPDHLQLYENIRRALYVCCWQKLETESAEMWRDYCPKKGGLAIQSTERQLQHQFARMRTGREMMFFRDIDYVDHESHNPRSHGIPEQAFLKRKQYISEREIRFAWFLPEIFCGTQAEIENCLRGLPDGRRLPIDLAAAAESVVLNPVASPQDRALLTSLISRTHPSLIMRLRNSVLLP